MAFSVETLPGQLLDEKLGERYTRVSTPEGSMVHLEHLARHVRFTDLAERGGSLDRARTYFAMGFMPRAPKILRASSEKA